MYYGKPMLTYLIRSSTMDLPVGDRVNHGLNTALFGLSADKAEAIRCEVVTPILEELEKISEVRED
jgi:hypothetical protein